MLAEGPTASASFIVRACPITSSLLKSFGRNLTTLLLHRTLDGTMVIAMVAVGVMQVPVDEIVHMIGMRDAVVPAPRTVHMGAIMSSARMTGGAFLPVRPIAFKDVFVYMITVHVMQMPVVQIVGMAIVPDRGVTAARSMRVRVMLVLIASLVGFLYSSLSHRSSSRRW
jgi:hypothetical protein